MATIMIPARYESTRFPGKPLAMINGKEMILHVVENCARVVGADNVIVATDDERIEKIVVANGYNANIVKGDFKTGCDRIAHVAYGVDDDVIVNVQGDEPLVHPEDIANIIRTKRTYHNHIINMYRFENNEEIKQSMNIPKIITAGNYTNDLLYATRQPCPTHGPIFKRQIGIYAFYKTQLTKIYGDGYKKTELESLEDIEILRCIETHNNVMMIKTKNKYQSVDVPADIEKVERILNERE